MPASNNRNILILLLQIAAVAVFWGRAWQCWFWDIPLRALLWNQELMEPVINSLLGMDWESYATSMEIDRKIEGIKHGLGIFFGLSGIAAITIRRFRLPSAIILALGSLLLFFIAGLYYAERFFEIGQLIEYTAQWTTPLFLIWITRKKEVNLFWLGNALKLSIALTFIGHGLYAVGYYNVPPHFIMMIINIMGVEQSTAVEILAYAGYLDFIVAVGIFMPRIGIYILGYAALWGLLTSLARVFGNFYWENLFLTVKQWVFEVIYRLPHAILPLVALLIERRKK